MRRPATQCCLGNHMASALLITEFNGRFHDKSSRSGILRKAMELHDFLHSFPCISMDINGRSMNPKLRETLVVQYLHANPGRSIFTSQGASGAQNMDQANPVCSTFTCFGRPERQPMLSPLIIKYLHSGGALLGVSTSYKRLRTHSTYVKIAPSAPGVGSKLWHK